MSDRLTFHDNVAIKADLRELEQRLDLRFADLDPSSTGCSDAFGGCYRLTNRLCRELAPTPERAV
jgi:hypothetical protein